MADGTLRIADIPAYVVEHHGFKISRMTANNWTTIGLAGTKLHTVEIPHRYAHLGKIKAVTVTALESFLVATGAMSR